MAGKKILRNDHLLVTNGSLCIESIIGFMNFFMATGKVPKMADHRQKISINIQL